MNVANQTPGFRELLFKALTLRGLREQGSHGYVAEAPSTKKRAVLKRRSDAIRTSHVVESRKRRQRPPIRGCNHLVLRHIQVPHPKYGDKFPYFHDYLEPDPDCVHRRVLIQPAVVAVEPQTAAVGTSVRVKEQCHALTKSGERCRRQESRDGYCTQHGG